MWVQHSLFLSADTAAHGLLAKFCVNTMTRRVCDEEWGIWEVRTHRFGFRTRTADLFPRLASLRSRRCRRAWYLQLLGSAGRVWRLGLGIGASHDQVELVIQSDCCGKCARWKRVGGVAGSYPRTSVAKLIVETPSLHAMCTCPRSLPDNTAFSLAIHSTSGHDHHGDSWHISIMSMEIEGALHRSGKLFPKTSRPSNNSSSSGRRARPSLLAGAAALASASAALACLLISTRPSPTTAFTQSFPYRGYSSLSQARLVVGVGAAAGGLRCRVGCDRRRLGPRLGATSGTPRATTTSTRMVYGAEESEGPAMDPFDEGKMASQGQHVINWCG